MNEPKEPHLDTAPTPDKSSEKGTNEALEAGIHKTAADIRLNLADDGSINVQKSTPIFEDDIREIREQLSNSEKMEAMKKKLRENKESKGTLDEIEREFINITTEMSQMLLKDAEEECAQPAIDMPRVRAMIYLSHGFAKSLSAGNYKNPIAMNALKEWQSNLAQQNPQATKQLVESYKQTIDASVASEKPALIMIKQWIHLCTGFAPELAAELEAKYPEGVQNYCEYFIAKVETELAKEHPDMGVIGMNINVPANYYTQLDAGSTIPNRVKALQEQYNALQKK